MDVFRQIIKNIQVKSSVHTVLVEICDTESETWPHSERIFIIARADLQEIEEWTRKLNPDDISVVSNGDKNPYLPLIREGYALYSLWWD